MKFLQRFNKKKCYLCKEKKPKDEVKAVGLGLHVCNECNNPEKKQEVLDQLKTFGLDKLVNK